MRSAILSLVLLACAPKNPCLDMKPNANPYAQSIPEGLMEEILAEEERPFPPSFHFGSATAPYQIESGNTYSDWFLWEKAGRVRNDDKAADGPASEQHIADDIAVMRAMSLDSYRFGLEWGRLFPTREAFDARAPDAMALAGYHALLDALKDAGIRPMVTLHHFTLPVWLHQPTLTEPKGVLEEDFIPLISGFAEWAGAEFGDKVDFWITINEPNAVASGGWVEGSFPPGRLLDLDSFQRVYLRLIEAHARMYDALRESDRRDADGDGLSTQISFATHNRAWLPLNPEMDLQAARRMRYIANLMPIDAAVCGNLDKDFDEKWEKKSDRVDDPSLKNRLDFIALNFYGTAYVGSFDVEPFQGIPVLSNPASTRPKNDLGWDLAPESLLAVLDELKPYGLPIYITENGLADAADNRRPRFVVDTMASVVSAVRRGHDVRGYYHWSLYDNFEWAFGFCPRFGLYEIDLQNPARTRIEREGGRVMRQIVEARTVPAALRGIHGYGPATPCE